MRLIIIGAGGHGQAVREVALMLKKYLTTDGNDNIFFLDDRYKSVANESQMYGTIEYKIVGNCDEYIKYIDQSTEFYPAFGDNHRRLQWEEEICQAGGKLATLIHPTAYVAKSVVISPGTVIFPKAMVNTGCIIGRACIVNIGAIVDHGCVLNDACHVNSGAIVMAENNVPMYTKVDSGEVIPLRKWSIKTENS